MGCSPWGHYESDTTEPLPFHFSLSCIGEGNGNPLQCSCLENPRDGRAWWAAVYGVAQSQTWLKRLSNSIPGIGQGPKSYFLLFKSRYHTHLSFLVSGRMGQGSGHYILFFLKATVLQIKILLCTIDLKEKAAELLAPAAPRALLRTLPVGTLGKPVWEAGQERGREPGSSKTGFPPGERGAKGSSCKGRDLGSRWHWGIPWQGWTLLAHNDLRFMLLPLLSVHRSRTLSGDIGGCQRHPDWTRSHPSSSTKLTVCLLVMCLLSYKLD